MNLLSQVDKVDLAIIGAASVEGTSQLGLIQFDENVFLSHSDFGDNVMLVTLCWSHF